MKQLNLKQLNSIGATLIAATLTLVALLLSGCHSQSAPPPPPPATSSTQVNTRNMSPDDTVKAHMNQTQGGSGQ